MLVSKVGRLIDTRLDGSADHPLLQNNMITLADQENHQRLFISFDNFGDEQHSGKDNFSQQVRPTARFEERAPESV